MAFPSLDDLEAVHRKSRVEESIVRGVMARIPPSWSLVEKTEGGGAFHRGNLQVLLSVARYQDGRTWLHVSAVGFRGAHTTHLPTWEEMKRVKHDFIGPDRWAYVVLPSEKQYVNHNPHCLHLFSLLDGESALPDFTWGLGIL